MRDLSLWATRGLLPDLTVVLDVAPQAGRERRGDVHDRLESEPDDFHGRVRQHFLDLAAAEPRALPRRRRPTAAVTTSTLRCASGSQALLERGS